MNFHTQIIKQINSFDYFYEMSDSSDVYTQGLQNENEINSMLLELTEEELLEIKNSISVDSEFVNRYFASYFNSLQETSPDLADSSQKENHSLTSIKNSSTVQKSFRSDIFKAAWEMLRNGIFLSFSNALRASWNRFKLLRSLKKGLAYFSYTKVNGESREAIGTLLSNNFTYLSKGINTTSNFHLVKYWDVVKRGFRTVRIDRLKSVA